MIQKAIIGTGDAGNVLEEVAEYTFKISSTKTHDTGIPVDKGVFIVVKPSNHCSFLLKDNNNNIIEQFDNGYAHIDISGNTIVITDNYDSNWDGYDTIVKVYN